MFVIGTGAIQYRTASGSVTEPASSPNAFAVGAVCWSGFGLEPYSSQGPNIANVKKPDVVGYDGVSNATYGPGTSCGAAGFSGTSASSPGVAGVGALLLQQTPGLTPATLQAKIESYGLDMGAAGKDNSFGSGRVVLPSLPVNTALPSIAGTAAVGSVLTSDPGIWTGTPTPTLTRQWRRCDGAGANCANIASATGSTYTPVLADAASTIRLRVTGTNTGGSATADSTATAIVTAAPVNTALPTITGTATRGQTLTASTGTWSAYPVPTFAYQWRRCNSSGASCADIGSATASTYLLAEADVASTLRVVVTASNGVSTAATSAATSVVSGSPTNSGLPTLSGTAATGSVLTASTGTWSGFPAPTFAYQFERCDSGGGACANIGSATATATYTPQSPADTGKTIRVKVTATNAGGSATVESAQTAQVTGPPVNTAVPALSGTVTSGSALSTTDGTWTAYPAPTFGYEWLRCDAAGAGCVTIGAQTASSYTLVSADVGKTVRSRVTATNARGAVAQQSAQSSVVSGPPANTALPGVPTGTQKVGAVLTAQNGSWSGFPVPTFTYQWERCNSGGVSCSDIGSATGSTYTLVSADGGQTIRVEVTASNGVPPSATAESAATGLIAVPPLNTVLPSITGTAAQGATLTAVPGTWDGVPAPTFTRQWLRCDAAGANCVSIGTGAATYVVVAADAAKTIRVDVTGTNASGSSTARSAATSAVTSPPVSTAAPGVTGLTQVGATLTASNGTWTGFPAPTFTYQWRRCDAATGNSCVDIALATGSTYVPIVADAGLKLRVAVTGTNSTTAVTATSAATNTITVPPSNDTPPSITGSAAVGSTLTADNGTWSGSPTPSLTRQWRRCNASGGSCSDIGGSTGTTYLLLAADVGSTIRVKVTGTSTSGTTSVESTQTAIVTGPPVNTVLPSITGTASRGQTLTALAGTWSGYPVPTFAYQWRRCDSGGSTCSDIGANSSTYGVVNADVGSTIRVIVTASNGTSVAATSAATGVVTGAPLNTAAPTFTGTPAMGSTLTATQGTWDASPAVSSYGYQWLRCDDLAGNGCGSIAGATNVTYVLVQADVGKAITVRVTASNGVNPAGTADSALDGPVSGPPANMLPPTISGTTAVGDTLTAATGTWSGYPAPTFSYQWRSCDSAGANCSDLATQTASTYVITIADAGHTIRVVVTATNGSGSSSATSATVGVPGAPSNLAPPSISGTTQTGSTLTSATGSWLGVPAPTFTYQWERCDALGVGCADIALAISSTYVPGVPDLGLTLRVKVGASNSGGSAGPVESAPTAVITNPPAGGGGGGGGGGAGTSDLVAGISAPASAKIGDSFTYQVTAQDLGTGGSENVVATITLPAGVTLGGVSFDRGAGCTGTTILTCNLDFLNGSLVAHINLNVSVTANGSLVATVVVTSGKPDINPANNTASAATVVPAATPPPPPPVVPAPKLTRTGTGTVKPVRTSTTASVTFGVRLNRAARVKMSVKPLGGTKALLLRAGTKLGPTTSKTSAFALTAARGSGVFTAKAMFGKTALTRGKTYVVTLVATAPDGRKSTLTVRFKA